MVHVGMRYDDRINRLRIEREIKIALICLGPASLKKAAIEEDIVTVNAEEMSRTGHCAVSAVECDANQWLFVLRLLAADTSC